jgi:HTH-type transcriptional regulator, glycine betaine synthesis regulator
MLLLDEKIATNDAQEPLPAQALGPLEAEVIGLFVQLSRVIGQPRSLAEIYGCLFISPHPLTMDDLIERLGLSRGSASQGLRFLRKAGAVRMVYVPGDRRVHYEAVAELRNLVTHFLQDEIVPHLENGQERLNHIAQMVRKLPADKRARISGRITMLQSWARKGRRFLPMVVKILGR